MSDSLIQMDFHKKMSKKVSELLLSLNLDDDIREDMKKVLKGKRLQYNEANRLLKCMLEAMMVDGYEEDDTDELLDETLNSQLNQTVTETALTQTSKDQVTTEEKSEITKQSGSGSGDWPTQGRKRNQTQNEEEIRKDFSDVCRFFKNGNCKFGKDCRKEHPEICRKFKKHGLLRHNQNGCDSKCGRLHPNACRNSLKTKECDRENCRFFHIKGTTNTYTKEKMTNPKEGERKAEPHTTRERRTEIDSGENENGITTKDQVFLEGQQAMIKALTKLNQQMDRQMEEMRSWANPRVQTSNQYRTRTTPQHWRNPEGENRWASQQ